MTDQYQEALIKARDMAEEHSEPFVVVKDASFAHLATQSGLYPYRVVTQRANEKHDFGPALVTIEPKGE